MKSKNGFTLVELLAVVALIALLGLLVIPSVTNIINRNKPKLSSTTERLIYASAEAYLDANQSQYIKSKDVTYCITIQNLIDSGFFEENLVDIDTGEKYQSNIIIKSSYNGRKYEYELLKPSTNCIEKLPNIQEGYISIGDLSYYREIEKNGVVQREIKDRVYNGVQTLIEVPVTTSKIDNNSQLLLKIRRGSKYINGFTITGGIVNDNKTSFLVQVPSSASIGEYVIEVSESSGIKTTKNLTVYVNPIILFMGD